MEYLHHHKKPHKNDPYGGPYQMKHEHKHND